MRIDVFEVARQRSIKGNCCVKVFQGEYYYKGYFMSKDGYPEYPWNYGIDRLVDYSCAKTKKECMQNIDLMLQQNTASARNEQ